MSDRRSDLVFESSLVRVFDVTCHSPQSGCSDEEWCSVTQIVVPRRGVFLLHHRDVPIVADPNTALVFSIGETYQVSHPVDGGDQCTVLVFRPELVDDAFGRVEARHRTIYAATQLSIHVLTHMMATGVTDRLEAEESAVLVLNALAEDFGSSSPLSRQQVSEFQQRRVEEVRALLASQPTDPWHLESIARTVYCSPFHLARQFRTVTGESIARYLLRLRLALALDRLAQGETDMARLAVELGFAHHSHFSARFRSVFGATPTAVRNALTYRRFQQMSKIVTAKSRARS
jgi:AraC family transcriptional regulator